MPINADRFTAERLRQRLGREPARRADGGYDLREAPLARLSLTKAHLDGADLRDAQLRGTDLQRASLVGADLRGADLSEAKLPGADLRAADLRGASLRGTRFLGTRVDGCRLCGAEMTGAIFRDVALWRTDLEATVVADCTVEGLGIALNEPPADETQVTRLAAWCHAWGGSGDRETLAAATRSRLWRPWRRELATMLQELEDRLAPPGPASLSRASHVHPGPASVSRTSGDGRR